MSNEGSTQGLLDNRNGNAAQHLGSEGVPQEAAHDSALVDATVNTLSLEVVDELVQPEPEMDGDGARAECGAI